MWKTSRRSTLPAIALLLAACLAAPAAVAARQSADADDAAALKARADELSAQGHYAEAAPLAERALAAREKALGPEAAETALATLSLAGIYRELGRYDDAEPLYVRALAVAEKMAGPESPGTALFVNELAVLYYDRGEFAKAEPLFLRALAVREKTVGPDSADTAVSLASLAELYRVRGEYAKAEPLLVRAVAVAEKAFGPEHRQTAFLLVNLATLYVDEGQYTKAEPQYVRAVAEKALGPEHPEAARAINNFGLLYLGRGQYADAERLFTRALAIYEKSFGPDNPLTIQPLNNLAVVTKSRGQIADAVPLYERSLAASEKALGPDHPSTVRAINNLADAYFSLRQYAKAEPLFVRAIAASERSLGPDNPLTAWPLGNLANLYFVRGEYARSEPLLERALAIREKALGPDHPDTVSSLAGLAVLYAARGETARAIEAQSRANEARERDLQRNLGAGSERDKLLYFRLSVDEIYRTLSLHAQGAPDDPKARRLALELLLRRKGRVLDATLEGVDALRRRAAPADLGLLDELAAARADLSRRTLEGAPGADTAALEARVEAIEARVSARSAEFRAASRPVSLDAVRREVPEGALLVEFVGYRPYDGKADGWGERRYSVYTVGREGEIGWADLGSAARVDAAVADFREALRAKETPEWRVRDRARALDELVMRPVRALAGSTTRLLLAPDGALNLVPFAALVDEDSRYLVELYTISYLTSGRDLLRLAVERPPASAPVVVADPDFDARPTAAAGSRAGGDRSGLANARFTPLPGTAEEAAAVAPLLPGARVMTGADASESVVKRVRAPRVLHVATHGFFLEDEPDEPSRAGAAPGRLLVMEPANAPATDASRGVEHPLLRCGLGLAGANAREGGAGEDGILTGLEVAGLDLWGTRLVVLSACDTGVGDATTGEGVFGLRRALVLAGSETQVMSLWPVSDAGTRDLMIAYYRGLAAGRGRTDALRDVQLAMLRDPARRSPYYWASFIQSGAWGPLGGGRTGER